MGVGEDCLEWVREGDVGLGCCAGCHEGGEEYGMKHGARRRVCYLPASRILHGGSGVLYCDVDLGKGLVLQ